MFAVWTVHIRAMSKSGRREERRQAPTMISRPVNDREVRARGGWRRPCGCAAQGCLGWARAPGSSLPACQNLSWSRWKRGTQTSALPISKGRSIAGRDRLLEIAICSLSVKND